MANPAGHPSTLVARQDGNRNRLVHGVYSRRRDQLTDNAREIADTLLDLPHVTEADQLGAIEIGKLVALLDNVDRALADGRVENKRRGTRPARPPAQVVRRTPRLA